jgi:sugar/nucleoside kinase (ribokinase family)
MSLLVTGSIGIDSVTTPHGTADDVIGGSAVYFSWAAAPFTKVRLVGVVGTDFPPAFEAAFAHPNIDITGLERRAGSKTFRWKGTYDKTMNEATTLAIDLNVLAEQGPKVPPQFADSKVVFLAATHPNLQLELLAQCKSPRLAIADTRDFWIEQFRPALLPALASFDGLVLNDGEARLLTGSVNLVAGLRQIQGLLKPTGAKIVIIKKGEHGCLVAIGQDLFALPAYPLEKVIDPTGAGDSFAGGMLGYLAAADQYDLATMKKAVAAGTVMATFTIEDFSLRRISTVTRAEIDARMATYRQMLAH